MSNAFFGAGIAQGASQALDYHRGRDMRELQRREAEARVKATEMAVPVQQGMQEEQLKQLQMQTQQLAQQQFRSDTFNALRLYESDGDPRHLNAFLQTAKQSPVGGNVFSNVVRVDRLSNADGEMLKQTGIEDIDGVLKDPNLAKHFVVATFGDGSKNLIDMEKLYAGTGFAQQQAQEQAQLLGTRALAISRMQQGARADKLSSMERIANQMSKELGIPVWQAYERLKQGSTKATGSELERLAAQIQEQNPGMDYLDAYEQAVSLRSSGSELERAARAEAEASGEDYNTVLQRMRKEQASPTSVKEATAANDATDQLQKAFSNKYYETDFSDPNNRRKAQPYIRTIEKSLGAQFSEEDKRQFRMARQLIGLGGRAGESLTPEETGLIDSMLSNVNSYISDNVTDGKKGVAAYESFRNILRNALFGATLPAGEMAAFDKAVGSLGQQQGPVLAKLGEQLQVIKDNLSGVANMNDETLAHYYLGADQEKLSDVIFALDDRIKRINKLQQSKGGPMPMVPTAPQNAPKTPEEKKALLDSIFKQGGSQ